MHTILDSAFWVDIVLPEELLLRMAHDVGESLEIKIEDFEDVERAFVHLDYEWEHKPEHGNPHVKTKYLKLRMCLVQTKL